MHLCSLPYLILCLLLVGSPGSGARETTAQGKYLSNSEECMRTCENDEEPRYCYYHFTLELYTTMNRACDLCKPNSTDQIANVPQCQCIEADGFERGMLSINRMLPGPSIQVCQNDKIIVDVRNNIQGMEAALHWHGLWQKGSQYYDGVPFLTQCPIPSGTTFRYQFVASNPGTHFYHSHSGVQKMDGQYGSLIVRQSKSADPHGELYDIDSPTHVIIISDWVHEMSIEQIPGRLNKPGQLTDTVLINGKGRWTNPITNHSTSVQLESFVVQPSKRCRFRMINSFSTGCLVEMSIEGHNLTLIAQDGHPVSEIVIDTIISASGERVDFILNANQTVSAYWIYVRTSCDDKNITQFAILQYAGGPATPTTQQSEYQKIFKRKIIYNDPIADCDDPRPESVCASHLRSLNPVPNELFKVEPDHRLILPYDSISYSIPELFKPGSYPRFLVMKDKDHIDMLVDGIALMMPPVPALSQNLSSSVTCNRNRLPQNCGTPCSCVHTHDIKKGAIVEVVLYNKLMANPHTNHPFHLHGYSFHIFKMGKFSNKTSDSINTIEKAIQEHVQTLSSGKYTLQPAGKDTITISGLKYVIFRIKADNPGWWLFHCHYLYHAVTGMGVILHVGEQNDLPPVPPLFPTCHSYTPDIDV